MSRWSFGLPRELEEGTQSLVTEHIHLDFILETKCPLLLHLWIAPLGGGGCALTALAQSCCYVITQ